MSEDKLGAVPRTELCTDEYKKNNLPDVLARWDERTGSERKRPRSEQSFCVPVSEIAADSYDLSLNRYKEVVYEEVEQRTPGEILAELADLEDEIQRGLNELEGMLK